MAGVSALLGLYAGTPENFVGKHCERGFWSFLQGDTFFALSGPLFSIRGHLCRKTYVFRQPKNHQLGNFEGMCVLPRVTKFSGVPAWNPSLGAPGPGIATVGLDMMSSTNSVSGPGCRAALSMVRPRRCIKLASPTRSTPATRWGVCCGHNRTACTHSAAGMRSPRTRDSRQALNCWATSSRHRTSPSPTSAISIAFISCTPLR